MLIREPARALMNRYKIVTILSGLRIKTKVLTGEWDIEWTVDSQTFPHRNRHRAIVYRFSRYVAAEIESFTRDGVAIKYGFVGQLRGSILSGGWFDSQEGKAGYYGSFQIVLAPTMREARGKWLGFARDQSVKAGDLIWTKIESDSRT